MNQSSTTPAKPEAETAKDTKDTKDGNGDDKNLKKTPTAGPNTGIEKEKEVDLKASEEAIKKYKLKPGDYRVQIRVLEANDLIPRTEEGFNLNLFGNKDGSANPYVQVEILDQTKKTKPKNKTLNPIFNEQFFFEFDNLIISQLEEASIVFSVMDYNGLVRSDTLIGTFEVDLTTVYFSLNHELYQVTLLLYDPEDKEGGTSGMLKVNIEVLGPDDEPNVHNVISEVKPDANKDKVLRPARVKPVGHNIEINLFRAEHLPYLDVTEEGIDAFCVVKYAGVVKSTKVIESRFPEWNQNIKLACILPNQSKAVNVEVWDRDLLSANDLAGAFKIPFKEFRDSFIDARWANLYGPPLSATVEDIAETMKLYGYDIGSHYRGRVLYSIGSYNERDPRTKVTDLQFSFPDNPQPISPQRTYLFRVDIYEAQEIPDRDWCIVLISIGPYLIKTTPRPIEHGRCRIYEQPEDKKLVLPVNPDEIPDIIFYFADEEKESRRHSFARFKAKDFLNKENPPLTQVKLKEDKSLDLVSDEEFPGFIFAKFSLFSTPPPVRPVLPDKYKMVFNVYQLRVMVYVARDLPPADKEGTSDPYVVVRASGATKTTTVKKSTLNPGWYETVVMDVYLPEFEKSEVPEGISLLVYDSDSHGVDDSDRELLGRTWMRIENKWTTFKTADGKSVKMIYQRPRWKNIIYDATDEYQGKLLVSYALIPKQFENDIPLEDIKPASTTHKIHFFLIGVRSLNTDEFGFFKPKFLSATFDVSGDEYESESTERLAIKNNGVNINMYKEFVIGVPHNRTLSPLLDIHLNGWTKVGSSSSELLGYASVNLKEVLTKYYDRYPHKCKGTDREHFIDEAQAKLEEFDIQIGQGKLATTDIKLDTIKVDIADAVQKAATKTGEKIEQLATKITEDPATETDRLVKDISPLKKPLESATIKSAASTKPPPKEVTTFKINADTSIERSQLREDALEVDDIEREQQPDRTKGYVEMPTRGHIPKKGFLDRIQALFAKEVIEYEEYDTDPGENLNVIPPWIQGRQSKNDELEDFLKESHEIQTFDLKRGKSRGKAKLFEPQPKNELTTIASLKAIFLEGQDSEIQHKVLLYQQLLASQKFVCRVYILEGVNITRPSNPSDLPDSYVVVKIGDDEKKDITRTLRKDSTRPDFYVRYDFVLELPGAAKLAVELWHNNPVLKDEFLGSTQVDLEARHFNKDWRDFEKKPIEYRELSDRDGKGTFGRISMWVDLDPANVKIPYYEVQPVEKVECELRVIVWEAKEFEFDDEMTDSNDLYIRGAIGQNEWLETDTHWRARAKATYNWRWKFNMSLPIGPDDYKADMFRVQLWDRDLVTSNSMIGECEIDMNQHRMLDKVYKRRSAVRMMKRFKSSQAKLTKSATQSSNQAKKVQDKQDKQDKLKKSKTTATADPKTPKTDPKTDPKADPKAKTDPNAKAEEPKPEITYIMTDQIWYDVFHPEKLDQNGNKRSVGKVLLSFELMPKEEAEKKKNSNGRDQPNNFPALPEPIGRFSFDILSPLKMLKEILGPRLYRTICLIFCCLIVLVIGVAFGYFIVTTVVGVKIAN